MIVHLTAKEYQLPAPWHRTKIVVTPVMWGVAWSCPDNELATGQDTLAAIHVTQSFPEMGTSRSPEVESEKWNQLVETWTLF
jgi:hypothetical protein